MDKKYIYENVIQKYIDDHKDEFHTGDYTIIHHTNDTSRDSMLVCKKIVKEREVANMAVYPNKIIAICDNVIDVLMYK